MRVKTIVLATIAFVASSSLGYAQTSQVKIPKIDTSVGQLAYLRDKLPEDTIGYVRISHPVVHYFSAKNRTTDKVLQHKQSVNALKDFREVLANESQLTARLQGLGLEFSEDNLKLINYLSALIYQHLNGPIEGVILDKSQSLSLNAQGLISIPVSVKSVDDLNQLLENHPMGPSVFSFDENGYGTHESTSFYFSPKEGRIFAVAGLKLIDLAQIKEILTTLKTQKQHEMYAYENQIDLTGQNTFVWFDLRQKGGLISAGLEQAPVSFLKDIDGIAVGAGTNHQKQGQLKLIVKTDAEKILGLDSTLENNFDFKTIGEPKGAVIMPIPSERMIKRAIVSYLSSSVPSYLKDDAFKKDTAKEADVLFEMIRAELEANSGFDLTEALAIFGPNLTLYYDDLGMHTVLSLKDKKAFYQWLEAKNKAGILSYDKEGKTHHLSFRNPLVKLLGQQDLSEEAFGGLAVVYPYINEYVAGTYNVRALDANLHFYWSDEGDAIRISSLPQIVEEEAKFGKEKFEKWLTKKQGIDSENILFAATLDWKNSDRHWYYNYLKLLRNGSEILGTDFDVAKMPRADQMSFADSSRLGLQVTASDQFFTVSFDYGSDNTLSFLSTLLLPVMTAPFAKSLGELLQTR